MNFDLSEDQALFKATVERFIAPLDVEARKVLRNHEDGYDRARWQELAKLGLIALACAEEQGGMGGALIDLAVIAETLGQGNAADPWLENGVLPTRLLAHGGAEETLSSIIDGSRIAAFAFAERTGRFNLVPNAVKATAKGAQFILSGEKHFVMGGAMADSIIVTANLDGATAIFVVDRNSEGLHRRVYRLTDGSIATEIRFHNVAAAAANRLDVDADGLESIVAEIRLLASAEMIGLAQRLLDDTVAYVKEREQFGVAIGSFQAVQHRLVECYAALEQGRSILLRVALAPRSDITAWQAQIAGAKAFIDDQADRIAREAIQLHGGMGITDEFAIGHAVKRILVLSRMFGDTATNLAQYAEAA